MSAEDYFNLQLSHYNAKFLGHEFHIDTVIISLFIGGLSLWLLNKFISKELILNPSARITKTQALVEIIYEYITDKISLSRSNPLFAIVHSFALVSTFWIFGMNLLDLLPKSTSVILSRSKAFSLVATEDINFTLSLGFISLLLFICVRLSKKGFVSTLKHYCKHPLGYIAFPINVVLNLAETLSPSVSLGARLFGNMFAGSIVFILCGMAPYGMASILSGIWTMFHFPMSLLQIVVFLNLSLKYIQSE